MALSCFVGRDISDFPDPEGIRFKTFQLSRFDILFKVVGFFYFVRKIPRTCEPFLALPWCCTHSIVPPFRIGSLD